MIKSFFKNSFVYTIGTALTRGLGIFLIPVYTRYLSPSEYGVIDLFMILGSVVSLSIALEIHQAVVRFYQDTQDEIAKTEYVSSAFIFSIFVYILYFILSLLFSDRFTIFLLEDLKYQNIFLLASGAIAMNGLFYFTSGQLKWQILPKQSVIVSTVHATLVASVAIYLLVVKEMQLESIFIGQLCGSSIGILLSIYFTKKSYKFIFVYEKFQEMIVFSYPLVFSGIAIFVAFYIDRIVVKELLGLEALGIYGVAYRFSSLAGLVMIGFQSSLSPLIFKHYKEERTPINIARLYNGFILLSLFTVAGSILFSNEVVRLLSTKEFYNASILIPILITAVFFSNMHIFAPGIAIVKKTKILASISVTSAILNTILNYTLIPTFGLQGAAIATLFSTFIIAIMTFKISQNYYMIPYQWKYIIFSFFMVVSSSYFIEYLFEDISLFNVGIKMVYLCIVMMSILYILISKSDRCLILQKIKEF